MKKPIPKKVIAGYVVAVFAFVAVACGSETENSSDDAAKEQKEKATLKKKQKAANRVCRRSLKSTVALAVAQNGWTLLDYKYENVGSDDVYKPGDSLGPYAGKWSAFCGAGVSYAGQAAGFKQVENKLITAYAYERKPGKWVFDAGSVEEDNLNP